MIRMGLRKFMGYKEDFITQNIIMRSIIKLEIVLEGNMFEVKFGTPRPIQFRDYWSNNGMEVDIDLDARFVGKCEVSEYDKSRYADDEAVTKAIKENASSLIESCLKNWPEGKPKVKGNFYNMDYFFDGELKKIGITAKSEFASKVLTPDSEQLYKDYMNALLKPQTDYGWDHVCFPEKPTQPEGYFCVRAGLGVKLADSAAFYKPGDKVEAPDLEVEYGNIIKIKFTMPDHDVDILVGSRSVMGNVDNSPVIGFMGLMDVMNNGKNAGRYVPEDKPIVSDGSEWICPNCETKNTGRFCYNCGGVRPQQ